MALPFLLVPAAIALAGYGAKKGYDGYQKHSEADEIIDRAKDAYESQRKIVVTNEKNTHTALERLGKKELEIGQGIYEFKKLADSLLKKLEKNSSQEFKLTIPKHNLDKIEEYGFTATGVLGTAAGAGAAGAAAGFAVYGGVMALGAASTGTAISALSGVAATNATLAAIGGGSLATGGLGMAGGTAILGGAVVAPVLAIAGWAYDSHGDEAIKNAKKAASEANSAIEKLKKSSELLANTNIYAQKIEKAISTLNEEFVKYHITLRDIESNLNLTSGESRNNYISSLSSEIMQTINNGYMLASLIVEIIITPIFRIKNNANDGVIVFEEDPSGNKIINESAINNVINNAENKLNGFGK
ncbi:MAG: hypothetical protein WAO12_11505 [Venatoribacter sp.]